MFGMGGILKLLPINPDAKGFGLEGFGSGLEQQLWFEYLAVSPSYELARRHRSGELTAADVAKLPSDIDRVLSVYDNFGAVQKIPFWTWWRTRGVRYFEVDGHPKGVANLGTLRREDVSNDAVASAFTEYTRGAWVEEGLHDTLILAIPAGLHISWIMREVRDLVENAQKSEMPRPPSKPIYTLAGKRLHWKTLLRYLYVLYYREMLPDADLWQIGAQTQISRMHSPYIDPVCDEPNDSNAARRQMLAVLTSRALLRARFIAENAARGVFPSHQKPEHALKFDDVDLRALMIARDDLRVEAECIKRGITRDQYPGRQIEKLVKLMPRIQPSKP